MQKENTEKEYTKTARRVSLVAIICNVLLSMIKTFAGIIAHSSALISDGVNSVFDVVSGIIVIMGRKAAGKEPDEEHPYGHERLESVASLVLSFVLVVTAVFIGHTVVEDIITGEYLRMTVPGVLTIAAAVLSIAVKFGMFRYINHNAEKLKSLSMKAEAMDCKADVISTSGALAGIIATRCGIAVGDLVASLFVCFFILRTAYSVFREAIDQMIDKKIDDEVENSIRETILGIDGVLGIDSLKTRVFGNKVYVDVEIEEDGEVPLKEAHYVAERVHDMIEQSFPDVKHVMVHVNPR